MKSVLFILILSVFLVRAQDQEYIQIYNLIAQADAAKDNGQAQVAAARYRDAQSALQKLQTAYPKWNDAVVKFRLQYVAEKLQSVGLPTNPTNEVASSATPAPATKVIPTVDQLRQLQSEKVLLEAKLKEALSVQPNAGRPEELAQAREQMISLQKERDLLKVALDQQQKSAAEQKGEQNSIEQKKLTALEKERDELQKKLALASVATPPPATKESGTGELEQLRARVEALEAKPIPYTAEELALFKQTPPQLAPVEAKPAKKSKELPAGAGALVNQAERAFAARRFDEAEKKYLEVLRQDEKNVYILGNLAATQMEMNKPAEVEQNIQRALEIDPDDGFTLTLSGMLKFRQGKFDEALNALSRAAKIDPQNPETQNYLGITLSQQGQRAPAEAALRKAIKIQPNYAGAHHNLAVIYASQRPPFFELARWHYDRALALGHEKNPELEKMIAGGK
ncbi:MAG: tetratricopeptide repeat protein [Verrucomicrobiota bacterium]